MTRKIAITARQVTALCKGAGKAGYIPEIILGDAVVRLVPESSLPAMQGTTQADENDDWPDYVPWSGPELNYREDRVLSILVDARGRALAANGIPLAGPRTVNSLLAHGFVGLEDGARTYDRSQEIHATEDGMSFLRRRDAHYRKYPCL